MIRAASIIAAAIAAAALVTAAASAQTMQSTTIPAAPPTAALNTGALTLNSTIIHQSASTNQIALAANTKKPLDKAIAFTCGNTCVVEVEAMIQVGNQAAAGNSWGGIAVLDGKANAFSPILSALPTNKSFDTRVFTFATEVKTGQHHILTDVIVKKAATLGSFHIDYRLFALED